MNTHSPLTNAPVIRPNRFWILPAMVGMAVSIFCPVSALQAQTNSLEAGTFCSSAPYGITMLVDRGAALVIDPGLLGTGRETRFFKDDEAWSPAGTMAPDGSYFSVTQWFQNAHVSFTWGLIAKDSVGAVVSADAPVRITLRLREPWSGCKTVFWRAGDGVDGRGIAANTGRYSKFHVRVQPAPAEINANYASEGSIVLDVNPARPAVLIATVGDGDRPDFLDVAPALKKAGAAYARGRVSAKGAWGDFLGPIADTMNGSRLFNSLDRRVAHVVGRGWWIAHQNPINGNDDLTPYFCWDSFFNGVLASLEDPVYARQTIQAVLSLQTPEGFIGNFAHWPANNQYVSVTRSQPPLGSFCVWKMHERWPDKAFLESVYPRLVTWHDWWHTQRAPDQSYLLAWGDNNGTDWGARLETGWDDTQAFEGVPMGKTCVNAYCVDLCSMWAMDAEYLAKMADALSKPADAARFRAENKRMVDAINKTLWNEQLGVYCNRRIATPEQPGGGDFLTRISPMNFYPLLAGVPDQARAGRMLKLLTDPQKFWGQWILPTLPYNDPDWPKQEYWHGHVWAPANYLVFQGVKRYASPEITWEFAAKSTALFMTNWVDGKLISGENYRSDTGKLGDAPHYTWGTLLPLIGLEAMCDVGPNFSPAPRSVPGMSGIIEARQVPFGGKRYHLTMTNGVTTATLEQP